MPCASLPFYVKEGYVHHRCHTPKAQPNADAGKVEYALGLKGKRGEPLMDEYEIQAEDDKLIIEDVARAVEESEVDDHQMPGNAVIICS